MGVSRALENKGNQDENAHTPADYLPLASMGFVAYMLHFPALGHRPGIVLTVLLIFGAFLAYRALKRPQARVAYGLGGAASFFLLNYWVDALHALKPAVLGVGLHHGLCRAAYDFPDHVPAPALVRQAPSGRVSWRRCWAWC